MSITGEPDGPPIRPGPSLGDTGTGMLMAISILGALYERRATGQGRRLQVAMQDAMLHYIRFAFQTQAVLGRAAPRNSNRSNTAPSGIFPCAPGGPNDWIYVFARQTDHWHRLLKLLGREELIGDPRYETAQARGERIDEVNAMVADWTKRRDKHEAMRLIGAAGVPAGAVLDTMELMNEPSFTERGILQTAQHPTGPFKMPSWPVRFDGAPPKLEPAPLLGPAFGRGLRRMARHERRRYRETAQGRGDLRSRGRRNQPWSCPDSFRAATERGRTARARRRHGWPGLDTGHDEM